MGQKTQLISIVEADLPLIDISHPNFWQDIHAPLAQAREQSAVARTEDGTIYVLRYDEIDHILKDRKFLASDLLGMQGLKSGPVWEWWMRVMFSRNPPDHTRLRRLVSRAFTPRRVDAFNAEIASQATALFEPAFERGTVEAIADVSHILASNVTAAFIGIPESDWGTFQQWTSDIGLAFGAAADPDVRIRVESALDQLSDYVNGLLARRRAQPGDDLLSTLLSVEEDGDRLSYQELVDLVENLMFAGHDTTRSAIGVVLMVLAEYPEAFQAIRDDPQLVESSVEEALRFENIIFTTIREAGEDLEFLGYHLPAGTPLAVCIPSGSRDPRHFANPDVFDIRRPERSNSFGGGIHYCLGAMVAQAELHEVVRLVSQRCRAIALAEPVEWVPFAHLRRPKSVRLLLETI